MVGRVSSGGIDLQLRRGLWLRLRLRLCHGKLLPELLRQLRVVLGLPAWADPTAAARTVPMVSGRLVRRLLWRLV